MDNIFSEFLQDIVKVITTANPFRSTVILLVSFIVAFLLSKIVGVIIIKIAQKVASSSDNASSYEKKVQLRQTETYLSVAIAVTRAVIIGVVAFYAWQLFSGVDGANKSSAAIGASAFFIVIAGATIGMVLRDVTAGTTMILEKWFNIGEFIKIEPFIDLSGVVEKMTLRSTKLRSISGEVIWVHNQHIQAVQVTPMGMRKVAVDVFVNNENVGMSVINKAIETLPVGTLKMRKTPKITRQEKWDDRLWYFTVVGEMSPGREWLMEEYFIESIEELDKRRKGPATLVRPPIARYVDERAMKAFRRTEQLAEQADKES